MKNTLKDLNNHLFAEIERLGDEELTGDNLLAEIERARAITSVSKQIIENGALALKAEEFKYETLGTNAMVPKFLEG